MGLQALLAVPNVLVIERLAVLTGGLGRFLANDAMVIGRCSAHFVGGGMVVSAVKNSVGSIAQIVRVRESFPARLAVAEEMLSAMYAKASLSCLGCGGRGWYLESCRHCGGDGTHSFPK